MTRHAYRTRSDWRGIGWWFVACIIGVALGYACGAVCGVLGVVVVLLIGVALA